MPEKYAPLSRLGLGFGVASLSLVFAMLGGCAEKQVGNCVENIECPSAHVCEAGKCEKLCQYHDECGAGLMCDGTFCVAGTPDTPVIEGIFGNSTQMCDVSQAQDQNCLGTGFVVNGQHLGGSTFILRAEEAGLTDVLLVYGARNEDDIVDLVPDSAIPGDTIPPGTYTLVAQNSSGTDQAGLLLMRGEQGDLGPQGIQGIIGPRGYTGDDGPQGPSGTANLLIHTVTTAGVEEKATASISLDRMVVAIEATDVANTVSTAIDDGVLMDLCADEDGCDMSIAVSGIDLGSGNEISIPYPGRNCRFFVRELTNGRHWTVSPDCVYNYTISTSSGAVNLQPYASGNFGIDGDNASPGIPVLNYWGASCYVAESEPDVAASNGCSTGDCDRNFTTDAAKGFYFVAAGSDWVKDPEGGPNKDFTGVARGCHLTIRD